jgi:hypothetical protein
MAVIAFDINAIREYSLKEDEGPDRTVFSIGRIDSVLRSHIMDSTAKFSKDSQASERVDASVGVFERFYLLTRFGVKGWKNLKDSGGNEIPFDQVSVPVPGVGTRQGLSERAMNLLQPWISELAFEVLEDNQLSQAQEKN